MHHFLNSLGEAKTAFDRINENTNLPTSGTRQERSEEFRIANEKNLPYYKKALKEVRLIQDRVLDKIHPQFKQHFRNEYINILEYRVVNAGDNWKPFSGGKQLVIVWYEWVNAHIDDLEISFDLTHE